jgi:hypothetical protein
VHVRVVVCRKPSQLSAFVGVHAGLCALLRLKRGNIAILQISTFCRRRDGLLEEPLKLHGLFSIVRLSSYKVSNVLLISTNSPSSSTLMEVLALTLILLCILLTFLHELLLGLHCFLQSYPHLLQHGLPHRKRVWITRNCAKKASLFSAMGGKICSSSDVAANSVTLLQ